MRAFSSFLINPFYLNIGLLFILSIMVLKNPRFKNRNRIFVILASIQWVLLSGLRHITVGGRDVYITYNSSFHRALNTTWGDAINRFIEGMLLKGEIKEPGYLIFEKLVGNLTDNYQIFLFIVAIVFMVPFGKFVYKNSRDPFMSYLVYSTLFYSFFSLTGFRQTIATSLVVLVGYEFIKKRRLWGFVVLTFIAFTIHKSAIVFFPFYFLANKKMTKKYIVVMSLVGVGLFLFGEQVYSPIAILLGYENMLVNEIGGTQVFALMMILVGGVALWRMRRIIINNPESFRFYNAIIIAIYLSLITLQNQSFMRIQQYYSLFLVLIIPEIILSFGKKERVIVSYIAISILLILYFRNNPQYLFFWQGG